MQDLSSVILRMFHFPNPKWSIFKTMLMRFHHFKTELVYFNADRIDEDILNDVDRFKKDYGLEY